MLTQRVYVTLVLCTVLLFSCNTKGVKSNAGNSIALISDTAVLQADEDFSPAQYSNQFIGNSMQMFTAAANKISLITAKKGLKVTLDPAILEKEDGSVIDNKITVSIVEFTTSEELFKANAATISNGQLLSSGGSYFIDMKSDGQQLRIKKGKSLQVQFPVISEKEMQLFYGERDSNLNMNWLDAGIHLQQKIINNDIEFTDSNRYNNDDRLPSFAFTEDGKLKVYKTLTDKIYYYDKMVTIKKLVDTINRFRPKIFIDTIYMWPKQIAQLLPGQRIDSGFLYANYGPPKQFILKSCKELQEETESKANAKLLREEAINKWQPKSLAGQIQKYYAPSAIRNLGWINCDRFYQYQQKTDVELDLPITFNKGNINYFLIFKSFNGMLNGKVGIDTAKQISLNDLPVNQAVTLIAFTKSNGLLYQCKEDFIVQKNKSVKLNFKDISAEEMSKIFGKNVRI
jgi:hypothetical protein